MGVDTLAKSNRGPKDIQIYKDKLHDLSLTQKQKRILNVLKDPKYRKKTLQEKAEIAGVTHQYIYQLVKKPDFLKALKILKLSCLALNSTQIVQRVCEDALNGQFMQQKIALEMSGDYTPKAEVPQIQQFIANISKEGMTEEEVDSQIAHYFTDKAVDTTATESD